MKPEQISAMFDRLFVLLDEPSDTFIIPLLSSGLERFLDNVGHSILANLLIDKILKCFFHKVIQVKIESLIFFERNWALVPEKKKLMVARNIHDFYQGTSNEELISHLALKLGFFVSSFREDYSMERLDFDVLKEFLARLLESPSDKTRAMFVFSFPAIVSLFPEKIADFAEKYLECSSDPSPLVRSYWMRTLPDVVKASGEMLVKSPVSLLQYIKGFIEHGLDKNLLYPLLTNLSLIYQQAVKQSCQQQPNSTPVKEDRYFSEIIEELLLESKNHIGGRALTIFYEEAFRVWQYKEHDRVTRLHKGPAGKVVYNFMTDFLLDKCFEEYKHGNNAVQTITLNILLSITASTTSIKERVVILLKLQDEFLKVG